MLGGLRGIRNRRGHSAVVMVEGGRGVVVEHEGEGLEWVLLLWLQGGSMNRGRSSSRQRERADPTPCWVLLWWGRQRRNGVLGRLLQMGGWKGATAE
jgi:hypothetical protein